MNNGRRCDYAVIDQQIKKMLVDGTSMRYTAKLIGCSPDTVRNRVIALGIKLPKTRSYQPPRDFLFRWLGLLDALEPAYGKCCDHAAVVGNMFTALHEGKLGLKKVALV